ncbi:MAG: ABC transporter permease [Bacteroidetes bacterium]|uniref:ABC transporter permease n=1 Tax=Candidatus Cryptobacteroides intestinavium TaxID=2840766 RepID=A0A9D9EUT5_9BACT|nr:ABC transporter permease [Candidatus Cryptobacteroides intestinavium]
MLRNFFHTISHVKASFILNILGLAVAFAASLTIMMQVRYDLTFDTCYDDSDNIYRLDIISGKTGAYTEDAMLPRPLARTFAGSSPEIKASCLMCPSTYSRLYKVPDDSTGRNLTIDICTVSDGCLDVFNFRMVEGDRSALEAPGNAVIPESLALKLFKGVPATGRILVAYDGTEPITVSGVYENFPENASVRNIVYTAMDPATNYDDWGAFNYMNFVRLQNGCDTEYLLKNFTENNPEIFNNDAYNFPDLKFTLRQIHDLHFMPDIGYDFLPKCSPLTLYTLVSISVLIFIVACINFTDFSISLAPMRIRSIDIRRILGSSRCRIINMIICENICIYAVAYLTALGIIHIFGDMLLGNLMDADISIGANMPVICYGAAAAVLAGIVSNLYTALFLTSASCGITVKGNFALSPAGIRTRNILVAVQFLAAFIMMTATSFIYMQNRYMLSAPLGFDKDRLIVCGLNSSIMNRLAAFDEDIRQIPGVENVGYSQCLAGSSDHYSSWTWGSNEDYFEYTVLPVSGAYLKTMGIGITEGRDFRNNDLASRQDILIFNESARKQYGLSAGDRYNGREIVGFANDIHFKSFRKDISPMAFYLYRSTDLQYCIARVSAGTDLKEARQSIEKCLQKYDPGYPFSVRFYDSVLENTYQKEQKTGSLVALFSLIAIVISIVGVFSLVSFECGYRRKESAIRKVVGATSGELVWMFCRKYLSILCICFIVSIPVSIFAVQRWLEGFAYHIPLYWWVFPLVLLAITAVTLATVIWQSWSAAGENPVDNLRTE